MVGERRLTVELELSRRHLPSRAQVNRQSASRAVLAETFPCTVFSPDDLTIIQGAPAARRRFLDDALVLVERDGATMLDDVERALRQRRALLRQAAGRWSPEIEWSLDVWDARLSRSGEALAKARSRLVDELMPLVVRAYRALARGNEMREVLLRYEPSWSGGYAEALVRARKEDLRRAATTVGPHRDDLVIELNGRDARFEASQGEQRCLALSLRLAVHQLLTDRRGHPPVLLLDDVFSELDPARTEALVHELPAGQCLMTTALPIPAAMDVAAVVDVRSLSR
jgi:DNA replication and repair protein RecF